MTERYVKEDGYLQTMFVEGGCATLTPTACHRADTTPSGKLGRESNAARSDFIAAPLFHGFGLFNATLALTLSSPIVLRRQFDAETVLADIAARRAAVLVAVPVMLQRMLALPDRVRLARDDFNSGEAALYRDHVAQGLILGRRMGLSADAQLVIAGRSTDTALTLAPMIHQFKWQPDDWNRLAAGTIAGHIIECGAQCSGGNCQVDWRNVPDMAGIGYPIVEAEPDGSFTVTKHAGTGGRVHSDTVKEQLLYELGDPKRYITPDCVADFTTIQLSDVDPNRVRVTGIRGGPRPPTTPRRGARGRSPRARPPSGPRRPRGRRRSRRTGSAPPRSGSRRSRSGRCRPPGPSSDACPGHGRGKRVQGGAYR